MLCGIAEAAHRIPRMNVGGEGSNHEERKSRVGDGHEIGGVHPSQNPLFPHFSSKTRVGRPGRGVYESVQMPLN